MADPPGFNIWSALENRPKGWAGFLFLIFFFVVILPFMIVWLALSYIYIKIQDQVDNKKRERELREYTEAQTTISDIDIEEYLGDLMDEFRERTEAEDIRPPVWSVFLAIFNAFHKVLAESIPRATSQEKLDVMKAVFTRSAIAITKSLPSIARCSWDDITDICENDIEEPESEIKVRLLDIIPNHGMCVQEMTRPFYQPDASGLFEPLKKQIDENLHNVSGVPFTPTTRNKGKLIMPPEYKGQATDIPDKYLRNTPLLKIFDTKCPFDFEKERVEHMAIYGGSGAGKTQTLQHLICNDLTQEDPPSLIVIDSQGQMLRKIERLSLFNPDDGLLKDRLIIIDPEDEWSPALNMFYVDKKRMESYSRNQREMIEANIIELYGYVFASIAQEMTGRMQTHLSFIVRALLAMPDPTIMTLLEMLQENVKHPSDSKFADTFNALDPVTKEFFDSQFYSQSFTNSTRNSVSSRLFGILRIPAFQRMFSTQENKLNLLDAMDEGKIILVNTSKPLLKEASPIFGRYILSLAIGAAFERLLTKKKHKRCYLILDEASEYFDERTEEILIQARKCDLGLCYATQFVDQMPVKLRAAAAANTSIKFASGVSAADARHLAADMRTTPDFIMAQQKSGKASNWACHVRNLLPGAVQLTIPFGSLEDRAAMSDEQHKRMRQANRERYGAPPAPPSKPEPEPETAPDYEDKAAPPEAWGGT